MKARKKDMGDHIMSDEIESAIDDEQQPTGFKRVLQVLGDWPIGWAIASLALGIIALFPAAGIGITMMAISGLMALVAFALGIRAIGAHRHRALAITAMAISTVIILFYVIVVMLFISVANAIG